MGSIKRICLLLYSHEQNWEGSFKEVHSKYKCLEEKEFGRKKEASLAGVVVDGEGRDGDKLRELTLACPRPSGTGSVVASQVNAV